MKRLNLLFQVSTIVSMLVAGVMTFAIAQNANESNTQKFTIDIEVIENGEVTRITKEVDTFNGQDIHEILQGLDVLDDMDISGTGQRLEIKVKKEIDGDIDENVQVKVFSNGNSFQWSNDDAEHEKRPLLGVFIDTYDKDGQKGAKVSRIVENSAAEKAGLQEGDVITKVNRTVISSDSELKAAIKEHEVGEKVTVEFLRDGKLNKEKIALGESESGFHYSYNSSGNGGSDQFYFNGDCGGDMGKLMEKFKKKLEDADVHFNFDFDYDSDGAFLGVTPGETTEGIDGVLLNRITAGSSAEKMGLKSGDRVMKMDGKAVNSFDELADVVSSAKAGDAMEIEYERDGKTQTASGELGKRGDGHHGMRMMKFGSDCHAGSGKYGGASEIVKEVRVVIEIKDVTEDDEELLAKPAAVDFDKELALNKIEFAPNPNDGQFNLEFDLPEKMNTRVMVLDQMGRKVYEEELRNFDGRYSNRIDISSQQNGVYFLIIAQGDKQFTKKIVKQ